MADNRRDALNDYARLVSDALTMPGAFEPVAESPSAIQVERGTVFPLSLRTPTDAAEDGRIGRVFELARRSELASVAVVDRAGHHRPVYRPLLVYACLVAFRLTYEILPRADFGRWEEGLRPWCDLLEAELTGFEWRALTSAPADTRPGGLAPGGAIPAARGALATEAAWSALALFVAGKVYVRDAWTDLASDTFGRITRAQTASGALLAAAPSDNPETHWFHELVLLHAAASYAVQAEDRPVAAAVSRAAAYHLRETQPDHATQQPWGLFAFAWGESTRPLADQLLHAARIQQPGQANGISSILLADTVYCLELFA